MTVFLVRVWLSGEILNLIFIKFFIKINKNFVLLIIFNSELLCNISFLRFTVQIFTISLLLSYQFWLVIATVINSSAMGSVVTKLGFHVTRSLWIDKSWYVRATTGVSNMVIRSINFEFTAIRINLWCLFFLIVHLVLITNHQITWVNLINKRIFLS